MSSNVSEILAVPAEALSDFYDRTEFCDDPVRIRGVLEVVRKHGQFYRRTWAEQTENVRQVIPCVVVRNGARLLCVKRAKKGRDDLRLRYTLLFGGHVDTEDSDGNREHILHRCTERELREELGLNMPVSRDPRGIVVDLATAASRRHIGVVFECRITHDVVSIRRDFDNSEFTRSRYDNEYPLVDAGALTGKKFDPWSQLLLASDFAHRNFGTPRSAFAAQLPLSLTMGQEGSYKNPDASEPTRTRLGKTR